MAEIPDKPFYKIGEVCQYTDTQPYVLRFWESEFPRLAPQKSRSGQRMYTRRDIDLVFRIKKLLYEEEFTIAGARKKLEQEEAGESEEPATAAPVSHPVEASSAAPEPAPAPPTAAQPLEAPEPVAPLPSERVAPPAATSPSNEAAPPQASPAERARAVIAETEIGALRKRIADLEAAKAAMAATLEVAEEARRRERERRERVVARLEALLRSLDRPAAAEPGELDDRSGIS